MNKNRDAYKLGTLSLIYWGASLMWFIDFIAEYAELRAEYFNMEFADILNDSILGLSAVTLGFVAWLVVLLIKDPKGTKRKRLYFTKLIKTEAFYEI